MKKFFCLFLIVFFLPSYVAAENSTVIAYGNFKDLNSSVAEERYAARISPSGYYKNIRLCGRVKIVDNFPDIKLKLVKDFPDLKVKLVHNFPRAIGEWQIVEYGEDFKIKFVENFEDIRIAYVENFPGLP